MFGYVRPAADRLTQEQTDLFRSAYCGLCRTLGLMWSQIGDRLAIQQPG